jgi:hypothetical protein
MLLANRVNADDLALDASNPVELSYPVDGHDNHSAFALATELVFVLVIFKPKGPQLLQWILVSSIIEGQLYRFVFLSSLGLPRRDSFIFAEQSDSHISMSEQRGRGETALRASKLLDFH